MLDRFTSWLYERLGDVVDADLSAVPSVFVLALACVVPAVYATAYSTLSGQNI